LISFFAVTFAAILFTRCIAPFSVPSAKERKRIGDDARSRNSARELGGIAPCRRAPVAELCSVTNLKCLNQLHLFDDFRCIAPFSVPSAKERKRIGDDARSRSSARELGGIAPVAELLSQSSALWLI